MTTRDTRKAFLKLLDDTWPGVQSEFVAAMRQARAGVDMKALEAAIGRGDVDAAFRALRFDAAAAAGIIAVHLYTPFSEALGLLNVTRSGHTIRTPSTILWGDP